MCITFYLLIIAELKTGCRLYTVVLRNTFVCSVACFVVGKGILSCKDWFSVIIVLFTVFHDSDWILAVVYAYLVL